MLNIIAVLAFPVLMAAPPVDSTTVSAPIDSTNVALVEVENDRTVPVTVYAQNDFGEHKLGVVAPRSTETMTLAKNELGRGDVQFFVHPAGQIEESTDPMELHRGERIGLVVPAR